MDTVKEIEKIYAEEYLDIDDSLVELEKDKDIIRMELNIVELPIFSKNSKRKKNQQMTYWFKHDKTSFVEVEPPAGYAIPGEFEERVFIALTKIMRNNNYSKNFYVTANEILDSLGVSNKAYYAKLKTAMYTLAQTNYRFKNSLYSAELEGIIDDLILTHIMDVRIITRSSKEDDVKEKFKDKRIKEIYKISFTDDFYKNIVTKGYLTFDSELLLRIENSVARTIYTLTEKIRKYDLYLKRPVYFIARRIPLKWDSRQLKRTMNVIEKALEELKGLELISDYRIIKLKKWDLAELEIFYEEKHNKEKRDNFHSEKKEFKNIELLIDFTEEKQMIENSALDNLEMSIANIENIMKIFPDRVRAMKTMQKFIEDSIKKYGYEYVLYTSEYVVMKNPVSFKGYLSKALSENYADEYIARKKTKEVKKANESQKNIEEAILIDEKIVYKYTWEDFLELSEDNQKNLENIAYEEFLQKTGSASNKTMLGIFEKSKKVLVLEVMERNSFDEKIIENEIAKVELHIKQENNNSSIVGEYISVTKFMVEVNKIAKERKFEFDLENVVPVFKLFGEYEDEHLKITYDEESKQGIINLK